MATIPSTLAPVISDYTPSTQSPSFSSIINEYVAPVAYANAGGNTLLASDVIGGFITHTAAGAQTDTLPTATLMVPAIQGGRGAIPGGPGIVGTAGQAIFFFVRAAGAGAITVAVGTGGTLIGSGAITAGAVGQFMLVVTATDAPGFVKATYTVYRLI
jgi:hypothetical protein